MSKDLMRDIEDLHEKFEIGDPDKIPDVLTHRVGFLDEEQEELKSAVENENPEEIVDALIDKIVVAIGTLDLLGIDKNKAWEEVHRANMSKEKGYKEGREHSGGQDLMKPPGWEKPNHEDNIGILPDLLMKTKFYRPASSKILQECIDLQVKKSQDYQSESSRIQAADYYPRGVETIYDILNMKMLRIKSVMYALKEDTKYGQNFESLEDSLKDLVNYASFGIAFIRGELEGMEENVDMFNRLLPSENNLSVSVQIENNFSKVREVSKKINDALRKLP